MDLRAGNDVYDAVLGTRLVRRLATPLLAIWLLFAMASVACAASPYLLPRGVIEEIARIYARPPVDRGGAVGVGAAIVVGDRPPVFFTYGSANAETKAPFRSDWTFEIASVTKVFTTNLLAQRINEGALRLDTRLSEFPIELGYFRQPLAHEITLGMLADFTAGFPDVAPYPEVLPAPRPTIQQWGAERFLNYLQNVKLRNYQGDQPLTKLPAPYFYSDFSVGLLGLILGANPSMPLNNDALAGWVGLLNKNLVFPLGMKRTFLPQSSPACSPPNVNYHVCNGRSGIRGSIKGYNLAIARANVTAEGRVGSIVPVDAGGGYNDAFPPRVEVIGGGGKGAAFTAIVNKGGVIGYNSVSSGAGYVTEPKITITCAQADNKCKDPTSKVSPIVSNGRVVGAMIIEGGLFGNFSLPPTVTITGGVRGVPSDRNAVASAEIANGQIVFIRVEDGGRGYLDPISVRIRPGNPAGNVVPIWAPAGALTSTLEDMSIFTAAALTKTYAGGRIIPIHIAKAFKKAELPRACQNASSTLCISNVGLSWDVLVPEKNAAYPTVVSKNGTLPGFSTQIELMPSERIGVVVFVNNTGTYANTTSDLSKSKNSPEAESAIIARNILNAIYYTLKYSSKLPLPPISGQNAR